MEKKKFYLTTAIAYTSSKPHIGNVYEAILADCIVRYKKKDGYDTYFQTGTDEHGQKIEQKAIKANVSPKEHVDKVSKELRDTYDMMNVKYDHFIRTTDKDHEKIVAEAFEKMLKKGDIYKGKYEGYYCVDCESYFTEKDLVDGCCPDCGTKVTKSKEECYFLKLEPYRERLLNYINDNPDFIQPQARKNEMINNFLKNPLPDLCVSRTSYKWGIPVNSDPKHVIYVWIDALSNYITFLGYDPEGSSDEFKKYWPCDLHLIGKDILRFHTIYWPIILMALDLPLPKKIFGHPWLLFGNDKMSKSKGNIVYADDLVDRFGVDVVRYYMVHEMPFSSDGTFTYDLLIDRVNTDLSNILGNLVNRTISMSKKYFDGVVVAPHELNDLDKDLIDVVMSAPILMEQKMNELKVSEAIDCVFDIFKRCNKYIDETTPWILAKDESSRDRLSTVMYNLLESIRHGAVLLQAILPDTADKIFKQLNTENRYYESLNSFDGLDFDIILNDPEVLFARIDKDAVMEELNKKDN